jgi:hypothetical protein
MTRYVAIRREKPRADDWADERYVEPLGHPRVHDRGPVRTGLLDKDGRDLYRLPEPIGFVRRRDD